MALENPLRKALVAAIKPAGDRSLGDVARAAEIPKMTLSEFSRSRGSLRIDQVERLAAVLGYGVKLERKDKR